MWVSVSATIEPQQKQKSIYEPLPPGLRDGKTDLSVASARELVTGYEPRESCTVPSLTIFVAEQLKIRVKLRIPSCEHLRSPLVFLCNFGMGTWSLSDSALFLVKWG